jgi:hypothetical protein
LRPFDPLPSITTVEIQLSYTLSSSVSYQRNQPGSLAVDVAIADGTANGNCIFAPGSCLRYIGLPRGGTTSEDKKSLSVKVNQQYYLVANTYIGNKAVPSQVLQSRADH